MNQAKLANALRKLGEASYELADALLEQPQAAPAAEGARASDPPQTALASQPEMSPFLEEEADEPPITERAVEAHGSWVCPIHHSQRIVPAGVSKRTGKPYSAFITCGERDCDEKPARGKAA